MQVWAVILQRALGAGLHGAVGHGLEMEAQEWGDQQEGCRPGCGGCPGWAPRPRCTGQCCSRTWAQVSRCRLRQGHALATGDLVT